MRFIICFVLCLAYAGLFAGDAFAEDSWEGTYGYRHGKKEDIDMLGSYRLLIKKAHKSHYTLKLDGPQYTDLTGKCTINGQILQCVDIDADDGNKDSRYKGVDPRFQVIRAGDNKVYLKAPRDLRSYHSSASMGFYTEDFDGTPFIFTKKKK